MRIPARAAELMAVSEETRARTEGALAEARELERQGRTRQAKEVRERLRPLPWEIAQESATLYRHPKGWAGHVPFARAVPVRKAEVQRAVNPGLPVTTVDLGENNLAVMAAWRGSKVTGTRFVRGREHEGRRMRRLSAIRLRQRASGKPTRGVRSNTRRWVTLAHVEKDAARKTAREIVDFAKAHGAKAIVFEALNRMPSARRTGWTRRQNLRRSRWTRGRILEFVRHMALWEGILVVRRDPAFTLRPSRETRRQSPRDPPPWHARRPSHTPETAPRRRCSRSPAAPATPSCWTAARRRSAQCRVNRSPATPEG